MLYRRSAEAPFVRSYCNSFRRVLHREREIGLELLISSVLQFEDGARQLLKLIRLRLGKDLQQALSEHFKAFLPSLSTYVPTIDAALQC